MNNYSSLGYNEFLERRSMFSQSTLSPTVASAMLPAGSVGSFTTGLSASYTTTIVFTADDSNTASWSEGVIHLFDGTTSETIGASNTGNITATTYIYYDKSKPRDLVTTTDPAVATGAYKTLLAIVEKVDDVTKLCKITTTNATGLNVSNIQANQIAAGVITTSELNFTPLISTDGGDDIIATINASSEGLAISADRISISGSTTFSSGYNPADKVDEVGGTYNSAASGARVSIFPDANTGIVAYNATPAEVFKVLVGGTDSGDVIIGNYAGNKGLKWDNSAGTFDIRGSLTASDISTGGTVSVAMNLGETNVKLDGANKRIIINDGTDDRILIGYQSGGF